MASVVYTPCSHQGVNKEHRLDHLQIEHAERPQSDQAKLRILEGDRIAGPPFKIWKFLHTHDIYFGPERAGKPPRNGQDLCQYWNICRNQRVPAGPEYIMGLAAVEKDRGLALAAQ